MTNIRSKLHQDMRDVVIGLYQLGNLREEEKAKKAMHLLEKKNWIYELKWDGYRTLAEIESGKARLYSRNNQPFNEKFKDIAETSARED